MLRKRTQIDNDQWTHLMSEIQVFNMFKLLKVVLLFCSAARASSLDQQNARTC